MPPYRNPVESRASKVPARQFVSDTHDHKPDAKSFGTPVVDFYTGTTFTLNEIRQATTELVVHVRALAEQHENKSATGMKPHADDIARAAGQISTLAAHLAGVTAQHINRRSRV